MPWFHFFGRSNRGEATGGNVVELRTRTWGPVLLPFAVGLLGTAISSSLTTYSGWAAVSGTLYYIPIVIGAIMLGARSAVMIALAAGVIQMAVAISAGGSAWIASIAQTVLFVCVAVTAAKLAEWRART